MMMFLRVTLLLLAIVPLCEAREPAVTFVDVTKKAGIAFVHRNGAMGLKLYPEPFGAGGCFFDYDGDGWPDLLLVSGADWPAEVLAQVAAADPDAAAFLNTSGPSQKPPAQQAGSLALYRNNHDGTFSDQTERAGLISRLYGMGCGAADYDNDGDQDLFVTGYGGGQLWRNNGDGTFANVTAASKIADRGWSSCAVWFDYDGDGKLDLFICHYVDWTPAANIRCRYGPKALVYCNPDLYPPSPQALWRNNGDGTFADVSQAAGIAALKGKALGAALFDEDHDGRLDLVVANDQIPNHLLRNNGDGAFVDQSTILGFSAGRFGVAKAGMGIDVGDYGNDGHAAIVVGNFALEGLTLHQQGQGNVFKDQAARAGLTRPSLPFLTFGLFFFDYDLDGLVDLLVANGHIDETLVRFIERNVTFRQRPLLFHNEGGAFAEVGSASGPALKQALVGRGAAYADIDHDGDLDVLLTQNSGPPMLLRNDGGNRHHWLRVALVGTKSNRDGIGATVTVVSGGATQQRLVKTGSSYLSQSELPVTFGLGKAKQADEVVIRWPSGTVDRFTAVAVNQQLIVKEGDTVH